MHVCAVGDVGAGFHLEAIEAQLEEFPWQFQRDGSCRAGQGLGFQGLAVQRDVGGDFGGSGFGQGQRREDHGGGVLRADPLRPATLRQQPTRGFGDQRRTWLDACNRLERGGGDLHVVVGPVVVPVIRVAGARPVNAALGFLAFGLEAIQQIAGAGGVTDAVVRNREVGNRERFEFCATGQGVRAHAVWTSDLGQRAVRARAFVGAGFGVAGGNRQPLHGLIERGVGNLQTKRLGARQPRKHIRRHLEAAFIKGPEAPTAVIVLEVQQAFDADLLPFGQLIHHGFRQRVRAKRLAGQQRGQEAAHGLFGAAIGVTQQVLQRGRDGRQKRWRQVQLRHRVLEVGVVRDVKGLRPGAGICRETNRVTVAARQDIQRQFDRVSPTVCHGLRHHRRGS